MRVRLGDVLRLRKEIVHPRDKPEGRATFVGLEHIESGTGRQTGSLSVDLASLTGRKPKFYTGDIVYGYLRPYLNKVWVADVDGVCSVDQYVYEVDHSVADVKFIAWFMRSPVYLASAPVGGGPGQLPRIRVEEVAAVELDLPSIDEQRRLVVSIRQQLAALERARAAAEAQLAAGRALPAALARALFSTPEASRWPRRPIAELGDRTGRDVVQTGPFGAQLPSSEFVKEGVPVLNIGNVQWGRLQLRHLDHVTPGKAASLGRYRVQTGDLLFTRSGTVGRCGVVPPESDGWLISYHLLRVAFDLSVVDPEFIVAAIRGSEEVQEQVRLASGRGSTRDGVNSGFLLGLRLPIPGLPEQAEMARALREKTRYWERLLDAMQFRFARIQAVPPVLLRRSFSGEL